MLVDKGLNELISVSKEIKNYTNVSFELIGEFENSKENLELKILLFKIIIWEI